MCRNCRNLALLLLTLTSGMVACDSPVTTPEIVSNTQTDIGHDHRHIHGSGQVHEHDHPDGFEGAHGHEHAHAHRHGDPIHGGRLVEIKGVENGGAAVEDGNRQSHYHAEVMPISGNRLTFYLLAASADGGFVDMPIEATAIRALVTSGNQVTTSAETIGTEAEKPTIEIEFVAAAGEGSPSSTFAWSIADGLTDHEWLTVTVPKLQIGSELCRFSFEASTSKGD